MSLLGRVLAASSLLLCTALAAAAPPWAATNPDADGLASLPPGLQRAGDVKRRMAKTLFLRPGVVGVGIGENRAGRPVIRVLTVNHEVMTLPASLEGVEVEREVTGRFRSGELDVQATPSSPRERWPRPVPIGVSIAHTDVSAGTLGCQVFAGDSCHSDYFILSNNHVIANSNYALAYEHIVQPGPYDGGVSPADRIGYLQDWEPIVKTTDASNIMDAAIALTSTQQVGSATPPDGYGSPRTVTHKATMNLPVKKYGRTTRMTTGKVTLLYVTAHVEYSGGTAQFVNQLLVTGDNSTPFSSGGDSGSLVVASGGTHDRKPVGLLFAGSGNQTLVSPIGPILSRFGVGMVGSN